MSQFGCEHIVDAFGCAPASLRSRERLGALVERIVSDLSLRPIGEPLWHVFGGAGGITGLLLLAESHLAVHTFPEAGLATFNLYHCEPRPPWPWREQLAERLGARHITIRTVVRGEVSAIHSGAAGENDGRSDAPACA